jgi:hypothetical protein
VSIKAIRVAFAHCAFTGPSRNHLGLLLTELQPAWAAAREDPIHIRRGRDRLRTPGAGRQPRLSFTDRVVITLVHLRRAIPHAALAVACWQATCAWSISWCPIKCLGGQIV